MDRKTKPLNLPSPLQGRGRLGIAERGEGNDKPVQLGTDPAEHSLLPSPSRDCVTLSLSPEGARVGQAALRNSIRLQISTRASTNSRIISVVCAGPGVKRRRSVPRGTVG
jgi:hypothetical protein